MTDSSTATANSKGISRVAALRTELVEEGGASLALALIAIIGTFLSWYGTSGLRESVGGTDTTAGKWVLILAIVAAVIAVVTLVSPISSKVALMLFADIVILGTICSVLAITKLVDANSAGWANPGIGAIISTVGSVGLVCAGLAGMYATRVFEDEWGEVL